MSFNSQINNLPRRTYISLRAYNNDFFSYSTSRTLAMEIVGSLGPVGGATPENCLKGAFLRETGKKLYPGVNPGITTYMVGVFDYSNNLHGFIDPNSPAFSPQHTDRTYIIDSPGYSPNTVDTGVGRSDQGPPVFTRGEIIAQSNISIAGTADISGNTVINPGSFFVSSGAATVYRNIETITGDVLVDLGNIFVSTGSASIKQNIDCMNGNINAYLGNIFVSTGNIIVNDMIETLNGNVFIDNGNLYVSTGYITVNDMIETLNGDVRIDNGNLFISTGTATVRADIETTTGNFIASTGTLYLNTPWVSSFNMGVGSQINGYRKVTFTGLTGITENSVVFVQNTNQNNASGCYSVEEQDYETFTVVGNNVNDASGMKYIVFNY